MDGDTIVRLNVVDGYLQSDNFVTGTTGWRIDSEGDVEFESGTFRGAIEASSIDIGGDDATSWHVDSDGNMWWGDDGSYAAASIKISSAGSVNFTTGTFSGTVTAATIQTGLTGLRCFMDSTNGYQFKDGATLKGKIVADTTEGIIYDTRGSSHFFRNNATEYAQINDDGLLLPSNHQIAFTGGSILSDSGSKLTLDRDFECDTLIPRVAGVDIGTAADEWRHGYINDTIFMGNNGKREADNATVEYNPGNNNNDCQWESVGNKRMQCNQNGEVTADGSFTGGGADFAEMFESVDGEKIPVGTSVVLEKDKIRKADTGESPVGVISETPTVVGNAGGSDTDDGWGHKYLKDDFGSYIMEEVEWWRIEQRFKLVGKRKVRIKAESAYTDEKKPIKGAKKKTVLRRKINQNWDKTKKWIPRKERDEWNVVGLIGRVRVLKGQPVAPTWIKLKNISATVEEWLIK